MKSAASVAGLYYIQRIDWLIIFVCNPTEKFHHTDTDEYSEGS